MKSDDYCLRFDESMCIIDCVYSGAQNVTRRKQHDAIHPITKRLSSHLCFAKTREKIIFLIVSALFVVRSSCIFLLPYIMPKYDFSDKRTACF